MRPAIERDRHSRFFLLKSFELPPLLETLCCFTPLVAEFYACHLRSLASSVACFIGHTCDTQTLTKSPRARAWKLFRAQPSAAASERPQVRTSSDPSMLALVNARVLDQGQRKCDLQTGIDAWCQVMGLQRHGVGCAWGLLVCTIFGTANQCCMFSGYLRVASTLEACGL